jgi:hypothetical protein
VTIELYLQTDLHISVRQSHVLEGAGCPRKTTECDVIRHIPKAKPNELAFPVLHYELASLPEKRRSERLKEPRRKKWRNSVRGDRVQGFRGRIRPPRPGRSGRPSGASPCGGALREWTQGRLSVKGVYILDGWQGPSRRSSSVQSPQSRSVRVQPSGIAVRSRRIRQTVPSVSEAGAPKRSAAR